MAEPEGYKAEYGTENRSSRSTSIPEDGEYRAIREQIESGGEEQAEDEDTNPAAAVDFELTDQYGTVHRLSDYRGQVVFLNFWATWCPPCRAEMPAIQSIYQETQEGWDDVAILGVASPNLGSETSEEGIREFLE